MIHDAFETPPPAPVPATLAQLIASDAAAYQRLHLSRFASECARKCGKIKPGDNRFCQQCETDRQADIERQTFQLTLF